MRKAVTGSIFRVYKLLFSPILLFLFGGGCRFSPTCSEYSRDAVIKYGFVKGALLSIRRIARCHPGSSFDYDPIN